MLTQTMHLGVYLRVTYRARNLVPMRQCLREVMRLRVWATSGNGPVRVEGCLDEEGGPDRERLICGCSRWFHECSHCRARIGLG